MTREQIDAIERLEAKATAGPWDVECPIDDENPWLVEAGKVSYEWRCLAMVTKSDEDINATEGGANLELLQALRNNAKPLLAAARRALELEEALEWMWKSSDAQKIEFRMPMNGHGYRIALRGPYAALERHGEGETPLEAIQNARRAM